MTASARTADGKTITVSCSRYGSKMGCQVRTTNGMSFLDGDAERMLAGGTMEELEQRLADREAECISASSPHAPRYMRLLSRYRVKSRISIMDAATRLGVSPAELSGYERGKATPDADLLARWIAVLGIDSGIVERMREQDAAR